MNLRRDVNPTVAAVIIILVIGLVVGLLWWRTAPASSAKRGLALGQVDWSKLTPQRAAQIRSEFQAAAERVRAGESGPAGREAAGQ